MQIYVFGQTSYCSISNGIHNETLHLRENFVIKTALYFQNFIVLKQISQKLVPFQHFYNISRNCPDQNISMIVIASP